MKPERRELVNAARPRVTLAPRFCADILDEDHYEKTGEELYIEKIEQEECVDPFDEGLAPEAYWAEGWDLGDHMAYRHDVFWKDDLLCRMFPTRYRINEFELSRSFRRVLKNNSDLRCVVRPFRITPAKDELDQLHCYSRFHEIKPPLSRIYKNLRHRCAPIYELAVFHPARGLVAFTLIETGHNASYAVRTAWTPDERQRSLGTFTFLKAVEYARSRKFEHHYVGPTILADPAFSYKLRFPACELYDWDANDWVPSDSESARSMVAAPLNRRRWDADAKDWAE